jgi:5'-methylthioadenosine phosphorylase
MSNIRIGLIGGTGLGQALDAEDGQRHEVDTPFGKPSSPIITNKWAGVDIAILQRHGEGHMLDPTEVPYRANIFALKQLGVTHIVASGATGSLREHVQPRDLVIADQVIDKTHKRPSTFFEGVAVHVEFSEPFCPVMRQWLLDAAADLGPIVPRQVFGGAAPQPGDRPSDADLVIHDGGTYVCMEGPQFSTRAESHMHRAWGGDLIGMTCMPEAKLAREAEIAYALVGLPTDYDCWRPHDPDVALQQLLSEIMGNLSAATDNAIRLIKHALQHCDELRQTPSPAHDALRLAIWSDRSQIDPGLVKRLEPLWGAYFG